MLIPEEQIWMIVVGFIVAFVLAFGIGANDVANSFGTSVGSKVLTLRQACALATVCELAGAILLGAKVSNTIRKGIVDTDLFMTLDRGPAVLMAGQVAALGGSCIWLLVATFFRLPVSGTHSIVGATVGFSLVIFGVRSILWVGLIKIVASWFISPLLSGVSSVAMFYILRKLVLTKEEPIEPALRLLPAFYGTVVLVNCFSIFYEGPTMLYFDKIPVYGVFIVSCALGIITLVCVKFCLVPRLRRKVIADVQSSLDESNHLDRRPSRQSQFRFFWRKGGRRTENRTMAPLDEPMSISDANDARDNDTELVYPKSDSQELTTVEMHVLEARGSADNHNSAVDEDDRNSVFHRQPVVSVDRGPQCDSCCIKIGPTPHECQTLDPEEPVVKINHGVPGTKDPVTTPHELIKDRPAEARVFSMLQILTAVFGSFAHGGNDVSNAIGPLIGLWIVGVTQQIDSKMPTPLWLLFYGGLGIAVGLWIWGRRVIQTLGEDLTVITPSSGVCIEIGSALTVLIASKIGLPISTTHCKVGSVVAVGRARSRDNVNWGIFRNILIAWLVTLPASGGISALVMYVLTFIV